MDKEKLNDVVMNLLGRTDKLAELCDQLLPDKQMGEGIKGLVETLRTHVITLSETPTVVTTENLDALLKASCIDALTRMKTLSLPEDTAMYIALSNHALSCFGSNGKLISEHSIA